MMMEEFESRVNFAVTPSEYKDIEKKYINMVFGDCDKDEFCGLWLKEGGIKETLQSRKAGNIELPFIRRYTNKELMEITVEKIKKTGDYKKAEEILDYFLPENYKIVKLTNYEFAFQGIADFGGSEGIYLDCYLRGKFDNSGSNYCKMGTFKTLKDDLESMKIMAELGGILNFYLSQFVNQNINCFTPEEELKRQAMYIAGHQLDSYLLSEKYQEILERGKNGNLTAEKNEALLKQMRNIEKSLPYANVQEALKNEELEHGEEI